MENSSRRKSEKSLKIKSEKTFDTNEKSEDDSENVNVKLEPGDFEFINTCDDCETDFSNSKQLNKIKDTNQTVKEYNFKDSHELKIKNEFKNCTSNGFEIKETMKNTSKNFDSAIQITIDGENKYSLLPIIDSRNDIFSKKVICDHEKTSYLLEYLKKNLKKHIFVEKISSNVAKKILLNSSAKIAILPSTDFELSQMQNEPAIISNEIQHDRSKKLEIENRNLKTKNDKCRLFSCKYCKKKFSKKSNKKRHELLHNPDTNSCQMDIFTKKTLNKI